MKAITIHAPGDLRYEDVPDPKLRTADEVILRVDRAAICGSDLHVYHGREKGLDSGCVMGHELVGTVIDRGRDVELGIGTMVTSPFTTSCGTCFYCRVGLTSRCEKGALFGWVEGGCGLHGAQAEFLRVPMADATLVPVPAGMAPEHALLAGDILSTGLYCADAGGAGPNRHIVVLGCGPVGLMAVIAAQYLGAESVHAVDQVPERLELARAFGARTIDFAQQDPVSTIADLTEGRGADVVLEAVGNDSAARLAYELIRPGGCISTVGVHTGSQLAFDPVEAYAKNITFRIGRCPARAMMPRAFEIIESGRWDLDRILTHHLPLADGVEGYRTFDGHVGGCIKVLLDPTA